MIPEIDSIPALLNLLAARAETSYILAPGEPTLTRQFFESNAPDRMAAILDTANAACANQLNIFGQLVQLSDPINWHQDPLSGFTWPLLYVERMPELLWSYGPPPADLKPAAELSRHQHLVALGIAYHLTANEQYPQQAARHITQWIAANPPRFGIHWFSNLEVAMRVIAWLIGFQFFRHSPVFLQESGSTFLKGLVHHIEYLANHLTMYEAVPNNHLIGEVAALALAGIVLPEFRAAEQWRNTGLSILEDALEQQTHEDGVNKEQASAYHRFVVEFVIPVVVAGRRSLIPPRPRIEHVLERMLEYMLFATAPDGTAPMWGDADDGSALGLSYGQDLWHWRPVLSIGALLFNRPDFKAAAGALSVEAYWLCGPATLTAWDALSAAFPPEPSRAFPQAGYYILRSDWSAQADYAIFELGLSAWAAADHAVIRMTICSAFSCGLGPCLSG